MAKDIDQKKLDKILSDISPVFFKPEVVSQYLDHQRFLLSGLNGDEEYKSRLAFTDAYKKEFEEIHEKLRTAYGLEKGENEFDYLKNDQFRNTTDKGKSVVFDMMKDYLSYRYQTGTISKETQNDVLSKEPQAEQDFRDRERLKGNERDFLIDDDNAFSLEKRQGLRDCRKWMYRNCSKSGMLNETGTKRNFIDSFGKRSVAEQINTLFQIERGFYKYKDDKKAGNAEKSAMNEDYIPDLDHFKSKMVRGKINPYRYWKKATGDLFYWTRMERALNKTDAAMDQLNAAYGELRTHTEQKKQEQAAPAQNGENRPDPEAQKKQELLQNKNTRVAAICDKYNMTLYDFFQYQKEDYKDKLEEYAKKRTPETYEKLIKHGEQFRRAYESVKDLPLMNEDPKRKAVAEAFADFTTQLEKDAPHMNANEITESWGEWWKAKIDLGITGYSAGSGAFSVAKGITTLIEGEISGLETAGTCVSVVGAGLSGVTAVKNFIQAGIGQYRQNYVADIKSRNKEDLKKSKEDLQKLKEEGKTLEADSAEAKEHQKKVAVAEKGQQEAQNINTMSKVSKSDNKNKKWMYVAAGTTAATSCALGITGVATTIGLPVTIAGGLVAGIGFGVNYVIQNVAQKNPAKKSVDNQMKLEDTDYVPQKDENGKGKRYIDTKVDERRQMLEEKKERFRQGTENYKNTNYYLKKTDKLKGRIRTNYTVKHNCATILTYRAENDKENANIAYRHVFLRDPDGPINDQNLLKPEEVKMYLSTKPEDLQRTGQTQKDAQQRNMYRDLLDSEGRYTKAPESVEDAKKRFEAKKEEKKPEKSTVEMSTAPGKSELQQEKESTKKDLQSIMAVKKQVDRFAGESDKLLKRLETAGEGNDKKGYRDLKTALEKAAALNEDSRIEEVQEAMAAVKKSAGEYMKSHSGLFKGLIRGGRERLGVAKLSEKLSGDHINFLHVNVKGMDTQKSIRENTSDLEKKLTGLNTTKEPLSAEKKKEHEKQVQEAKEKRLEKEQTGKKLPDRQALKK